METYPPDVIEQILHFNAADLRENRAGRLSARQAKRLKWLRRLRLLHLASVGVCAGGLVIALVLMALGLAKGEYVVDVSFAFAILLIMILSWGGSLRVTWQKYHELGDDLARQAVRMVEGNAAVEVQKTESFLGGKSFFHTLSVGNMLLPISRILYYPLKPESWCRVYYTSSGKYVLALERQRDVEAADTLSSPQQAQSRPQ